MSMFLVQMMWNKQWPIQSHCNINGAAESYATVDLTCECLWLKKKRILAMVMSAFRHGLARCVSGTKKTWHSYKIYSFLWARDTSHETMPSRRTSPSPKCFHSLGQRHIFLQCDVFYEPQTHFMSLSNMVFRNVFWLKENKTCPGNVSLAQRTDTFWRWWRPPSGMAWRDVSLTQRKPYILIKYIVFFEPETHLTRPCQAGQAGGHHDRQIVFIP